MRSIFPHLWGIRRSWSSWVCVKGPWMLLSILLSLRNCASSRQSTTEEPGWEMEVYQVGRRIRRGDPGVCRTHGDPDYTALVNKCCLVENCNRKLAVWQGLRCTRKSWHHKGKNWSNNHRRSHFKVQALKASNLMQLRQVYRVIQVIKWWKEYRSYKDRSSTR